MMRTDRAILSTLGSALLTTILATSLAGPALAADSPAVDPSVKAWMQRTDDRAAIHDLIVTYGRLLDARDLAGYSKLFAADGVWEGGIGSAKGPKEIQQMLESVYSRVAPGQYGNSYHIMSDFLIEPKGETATAWSRWTWVAEGADGKPAIQRSGHYEDTFVKEGGKWRFKRRLTVTEMPTPAKDAEARIFRRDHREGK
jgi:ketosteroid isomerase-like protein